MLVLINSVNPLWAELCTRGTLLRMEIIFLQLYTKIVKLETRILTAKACNRLYKIEP